MNPQILDDRDELRRLDPGGMLAAVYGLAGQCGDAWDAAQEIEAPDGVDKVVVLGMGGSAIAGDIWRMLLQREAAVPVFNVRQYDLPPFVDDRTLVIASSYSGNTEETLSAFNQALKSPAKTLAITSGGRLLTEARANGVPTFRFEFKGEPRAAIGWSLMPLLALSSRLGWMQGIERDVSETVDVLSRLRDELAEACPIDNNPAKQMAERLYDRIPIVYSGSPLTEVAHRWKSQLNESAKVWSFYEELPELHHNAIVGIELPRRVAEATSVVLLHSDLVHPRVQLRYDFTRRLLTGAGVDVVEAAGRGESALAQMMSLVLLGDYVSTYLACLYEVDPTPTDVIEELRDWLAKQG